MRALLGQWMIYTDKAGAEEGDWLNMKSFTYEPPRDCTNAIRLPQITGALLILKRKAYLLGCCFLYNRKISFHYFLFFKELHRFI